jgi:hypothetical protein
MLIEKVRQRTVLYNTKSPDYRDQHMRANTWKGIEKELKIKRKFYVSSRDVRIVCPPAYTTYIIFFRRNSVRHIDGNTAPPRANSLIAPRRPPSTALRSYSLPTRQLDDNHLRLMPAHATHPPPLHRIRLRLHWSQNRHNTTVWTDSREGSRNQKHYCLC